METNLNFENAETKKLLSKLQFDFFLEQNILAEKYPREEVEQIHQTYQTTLKEIKLRGKKNKKQYNYYLEGHVRKMFTGGLLPALFHLDDTRQHRLFDFSAIGENWAYFHQWQKYYKRKVSNQRLWDVTIKVGSILGILLSISKGIEVITHYTHS